MIWKLIEKMLDSPREYKKQLEDAVEASVTLLTSMTLEIIEKDEVNGCKVFERTLKYLDVYVFDMSLDFVAYGFLRDNIKWFLNRAPKDASSAVEKFKSAVTEYDKNFFKEEEEEEEEF